MCSLHDSVISSKAIATPEVTGLGTIPDEALSRVQLLQIRHQWHRDKNRCMRLLPSEIRGYPRTMRQKETVCLGYIVGYTTHLYRDDELP